MPGKFKLTGILFHVRKNVFSQEIDRTEEADAPSRTLPQDGYREAYSLQKTAAESEEWARRFQGTHRS